MKREKSKLVEFLLSSEESIQVFLRDPQKVMKKIGIRVPMSKRLVEILMADIKSEFNHLKFTGSQEFAKGYHMDDMSSVDFHKKDYY